MNGMVQVTSLKRDLDVYQWVPWSINKDNYRQVKISISLFLLNLVCRDMS